MHYRVRSVIQSLEARLFTSPPSKFEAITEKYLHQMLDELAAEVELSPSRLRVIFKASTGMCFMEYAKWLRMKKAWHLVVDAYSHITDIAEQLRYDDPRHFTRDFKQAFGLPPRAYRNLVTKANGSHHRWEIVTTGIVADGPFSIIPSVRQTIK